MTPTDPSDSRDAPADGVDAPADPPRRRPSTRRRWLAATAAGGGLAAAATFTVGRPAAPPVRATPAAPADAPAGARTPAHAFDPARLDAARLLSQATWGPTQAEIDRVASIGPRAWLREQFATAGMDTHWDYVVVRKGPIGCRRCDSQYMNALMESFWTQAARGPDQLRQRMVLALAEIFVTSAVNSPIEIHEPAHASWLDLLATHAFGNFRTLLEQVSIHPAMAHYLSHMRNEREDPATGRIPDENYAREVMQLFTIGLWELNEDGTRRQDTQGRDIPTYGQADVMGLARVFTGWSWNGPDTGDGRWHGWDGVDWKRPLQNYARFHSRGEKRFLGTVIPRGTSGEESLRRAVDTLFQHRNVGPFIGRQLIQRFVTSNPSPAYVARVARAFADDGTGVRGDLKAVLAAVLLDPEARDPAVAADPAYGKLREPMVRLGHWMRAFDARSRSGYYRIWNLEDPVSSLGQNPQRAPSVFNWFRPTYAPPGEILRRGLAAPEFQITHETTATGYANFVSTVVERGLGYNDDAIVGRYDAELALADRPEALLRRLDLLLVGGRMSVATRDTVLGAVRSVPAREAATRVHVAVTLTMLSPEYIVQK